MSGQVHRTSQAGDRASRLIVVFHQRSWRVLRWWIYVATAAVTAPRLWLLSQSAMLGDVRVAVQEATWIFGLLVAACVLHRITAMGVHVIQLRERLRRTQHRLHALEASWSQDGVTATTPLMQPSIAPASPKAGAQRFPTTAAADVTAVESGELHMNGASTTRVATTRSAPNPHEHACGYVSSNGNDQKPVSDRATSPGIPDAAALRAALRVAIAGEQWDEALRAGRALRAAMPDSPWAEEFRQVEPLLQRLCGEGTRRGMGDWRQHYPSGARSALNGDGNVRDEPSAAHADAAPIRNEPPASEAGLTASPRPRAPR